MSAKRFRDGERPGVGRRWTARLLAAAAILTGAAAAAAGPNLEVRGLVDIVGHGNDEALYLNRSMYATTPFDNLHVRVFLEGGSERTRAYMQVLVSDVGYSNFRFFGGYIQHQIFDGREIYLEAGKIPVHEGTWAPRTYSDKNPLLGVPLAYYYKSTLPYRMVPLDLDQLVSQRGNGQSGVYYSNPDGSPRGTPWSPLPILYENCWDYGAYLLGAGERFDWAFGLTMGSTGAPVTGPDTNGDLGVHAKLGYAPLPGLGVHVSFARGAYMWDEVQQWLPAGKRARDYAQTVIGGSVEYGWRRLTAHGEVFHNSFETPVYADGLDALSWYAESSYKFLPGWYVAGRYDAMRFSEVPSAGGTISWDQNIERVEAGLGYHATRELLVKAVGQVYRREAGWEWKSLLPGVQVSFRY